MLILLSPLFLILSIAIKIDSKGPVFYRQVRVTQYGKEFRIHKFRSMTVGADKGSLVTVKGDARVTKVGKFIRKTSIDEFPQFINVLKGEMSLVGPRPYLPREIGDMENYYPYIVDMKPGLTGLCKKVCPVLNIKNETKEQHAYIFQNANDDVRRQSTSGGAFSAIAEKIIDKNGIVYGVIFDKDFNVIHKGIDNKEELYKFRNSKYVQSNLNNVFKEVKENLEKDRWVCFSGTSCQIEGLKNFLRKQYEKLLLVDVVCRAVPSPLIWKKYLKLDGGIILEENLILMEEYVLKQ